MVLGVRGVVVGTVAVTSYTVKPILSLVEMDNKWWKFEI
jgi:hypothetical protein